MIDKAKAVLFVVAGVVILALVALFRYKPREIGGKTRDEILQAARDAKLAKSVLKNEESTKLEPIENEDKNY